MITALTDPAQLPNQLDDQETFDTKMANFLDNLPMRAQQENELAANMGMYAAGGAYAFPYIFDGSTADADPGVGKLRLSSATQNAASIVMRMDLQAVGGADMTNVLADLRAATSAVKGSVRLVKMADPSKWLIFDVTAVALPTGYRNLTMTWRATGGGLASPFANGDALIVFIDRNGDSGTVPGATELLATIPVPAGVSAVNALNVFDADHDWYFIHFTGINQSGNSQMVVRLAVGGVLAAGALDYYRAEANNAVATGNRVDGFVCAATGEAPRIKRTGVLQVGGANSGEPKLMMWDGMSQYSSTEFTGSATRGSFNPASLVSGFGVLLTTAGVTFTGGTIRVYGVRKV